VVRVAASACTGSNGKPTVLFLCVHNAGRSQMAMGFFQHLAGDRAVAWSGGSEPGIAVNPTAIAATAERDIDISKESPSPGPTRQPWTDETVRAADVVITMGAATPGPIFPGTRYEEWALDDPARQGLDDVRPIRDEIERRVSTLLDELSVPAAS
jgi:arsenate reductase (thioredoxin)